jgi:hypothetical protein
MTPSPRIASHASAKALRTARARDDEEAAREEQHGEAAEPDVRELDALDAEQQAQKVG